MSSSIRQAFARGKAKAEQDSRSEAAKGTSRLRLASELFDLLKQHEDLLRQAGYELGQLQGSDLTILRRKQGEWGVVRVQCVDGGVHCQAYGTGPGQYVFDFGATAHEAAENLMFHAAQESLCWSND